MDLFLLCSARACVVVCCGVDARLRVNLRGEIRTGLHEVVVGSMSVAFDFLIFDFLWSLPVAPPHLAIAAFSVFMYVVQLLLGVFCAQPKCRQGFSPGRSTGTRLLRRSKGWVHLTSRLTH